MPREWSFGLAPLAMVTLAMPLLVWSAINAGFFELSLEHFIIPLALFFGAPIAFGAALWAYRHGDAYLSTALAAVGGFWASYGALLWVQQTNVVPGLPLTSSLRGLLFAGWAVTFGVI